jgi:hypothetical protein
VLFLKIGPFKTPILQPGRPDKFIVPQRLQDWGFERIRFLPFLNAYSGINVSLKTEFLLTFKRLELLSHLEGLAHYLTKLVVGLGRGRIDEGVYHEGINLLPMQAILPDI